MAKKWDIDVSQLQNGWHATATIGPFNSREEAVELCRKIAALGVEAKDNPPPTLGINVSETIATKDKFG